MQTDTTEPNRRGSMRFPPQVHNVAVRVESIADVVNESLGGIALDILSTPFVVGQAVQVVYDGAPMFAEIIHIEPLENGARVGLRWV